MVCVLLYCIGMVLGISMMMCFLVIVMVVGVFGVVLVVSMYVWFDCLLFVMFGLCVFVDELFMLSLLVGDLV